MSVYYLGVDVGSTKSDALLIDERGRTVAAFRGGTGNPEDVGYDGLANVLQQIVSGVLEATGLSLETVRGAGFGVAGFDWPSQRPPTLEAINTLGLRCPVELVNDALITLIAGATAGWGVAVVAGTSCNAWGIGPDGRYGQMAGSSRLGEYAGSREIVEKALQAVSKAWSCRGPKTALTQAFIELTGATNEANLIEGVSLGRYSVGPGAAPIVFRLAMDGDPVAEALLHWAGAELGDLAVGIVRQLDIANLAFEVVLSGSFMKGSPVIQHEIERAVRSLAPGATFVTLMVPPVAGGALLGMMVAGVPAAEIAAARQQLNETGAIRA